eukprot:jgi/Chlat1/4609/Chrsp290S04348
MDYADEQEQCPLCLEDLDLTDKHFLPCKCGYQICLWCWHQIVEIANKDYTTARCPACRTPYDLDNINTSAPDPQQLQKIINDKKQKEKQERSEVSASRKHLSNMRVIQRNLVYVVGLAPSDCLEEVLRRHEHFGQFGKILKIAVNRGNNFPFAASAPGGSAYVTFAREEDAMACIAAIDGTIHQGRLVRACFGTTKYCNAFLRHVPCNNPDCLYLHDVGVEEDSFTKEEMLARFGSKHQNFHEATHSTSRGGRSEGPPQQADTAALTPSAVPPISLPPTSSWGAKASLAAKAAAAAPPPAAAGRGKRVSPPAPPGPANPPITQPVWGPHAARPPAPVMTTRIPLSSGTTGPRPASISLLSNTPSTPPTRSTQPAASSSGRPLFAAVAAEPPGKVAASHASIQRVPSQTARLDVSAEIEPASATPAEASSAPEPSQLEVQTSTAEPASPQRPVRTSSKVQLLEEEEVDSWEDREIAQTIGLEEESDRQIAWSGPASSPLPPPPPLSPALAAVPDALRDFHPLSNPEGSPFTEAQSRLGGYMNTVPVEPADDIDQEQDAQDLFKDILDLDFDPWAEGSTLPHATALAGIRSAEAGRLAANLSLAAKPARQSRFTFARGDAEETPGVDGRPSRAGQSTSASSRTPSIEPALQPAASLESWHQSLRAMLPNVSITFEQSSTQHSAPISPILKPTAPPMTVSELERSAATRLSVPPGFAKPAPPGFAPARPVSTGPPGFATPNVQGNGSASVDMSALFSALGVKQPAGPAAARQLDFGIRPASGLFGSNSFVDPAIMGAGKAYDPGNLAATPHGTQAVNQLNWLAGPQTYPAPGTSISALQPQPSHQAHPQPLQQQQLQPTTARRTPPPGFQPSLFGPGPSQNHGNHAFAGLVGGFVMGSTAPSSSNAGNGAAPASTSYPQLGSGPFGQAVAAGGFAQFLAASNGQTAVPGQSHSIHNQHPHTAATWPNPSLTSGPSLTRGNPWMGMQPGPGMSTSSTDMPPEGWRNGALERVHSAEHPYQLSSGASTVSPGSPETDGSLANGDDTSQNDEQEALDATSVPDDDDHLAGGELTADQKKVIRKREKKLRREREKVEKAAAAERKRRDEEAEKHRRDKEKDKEKDAERLRSKKLSKSSGGSLGRDEDFTTGVKLALPGDAAILLQQQAAAAVANSSANTKAVHSNGPASRVVDKAVSSSSMKAPASATLQFAEQSSQPGGVVNSNIAKTLDAPTANGNLRRETDNKQKRSRSNSTTAAATQEDISVVTDLLCGWSEKTGAGMSSLLDSMRSQLPWLGSSSVLPDMSSSLLSYGNGGSSSSHVKCLERQVEDARRTVEALESKLLEVKERIGIDDVLLENIASDSNFLRGAPARGASWSTQSVQNSSQRAS